MPNRTHQKNAWARPDPTYPVKPFVMPETGKRFVVVSDQQPDGLWKAFIAEEPRVAQLAGTQAEAEENVIEKYRLIHTKPVDRAALEKLEDVEDIAVINARSKKKTIAWQDFKKQHRLDSKADEKSRRRTGVAAGRSSTRGR